MATCTIRELLGMLSADGVACGWLTGDTVEDVLYGTLKKSRSGDVDFDALRAHIEAHGMAYPIHIGQAEDMGPQYNFEPWGFEGEWVMGNGHHRLYILLLLGATLDTEVEVTDDKSKSGYRKDDLDLIA